MQGRVRSRQETVNCRFKHWGCLRQFFRHDVELHSNCFRAVAVITQLEIEAGDTLFPIENYVDAHLSENQEEYDAEADNLGELAEQVEQAEPDEQEHEPDYGQNYYENFFYEDDCEEEYEYGEQDYYQNDYEEQYSHEYDSDNDQDVQEHEEDAYVDVVQVDSGYTASYDDDDEEYSL